MPIFTVSLVYWVGARPGSPKKIAWTSAKIKASRLQSGFRRALHNMTCTELHPRAARSGACLQLGFGKAGGMLAQAFSCCLMHSIDSGNIAKLGMLHGSCAFLHPCAGTLGASAASYHGCPSTFATIRRISRRQSGVKLSAANDRRAAATSASTWPGRRSRCRGPDGSPPAAPPQAADRQRDQATAPRPLRLSTGCAPSSTFAPNSCQRGSELRATCAPGAQLHNVLLDRNLLLSHESPPSLLSARPEIQKNTTIH
jgi:hypothetical protein